MAKIAATVLGPFTVTDDQDIIEDAIEDVDYSATQSFITTPTNKKGQFLIIVVDSA